MKKKCILFRDYDLPGLTKLLRIMKLTFSILLFSVVSVLASNSYSQTKTLNLNMERTSVKEVLSKIEDQSEFYFMYSEKVIDVNREISVNIENQTIDTVLKALFAGTDVEYTVKDRIIVLTTPEVLDNASKSAFQQNVVTGVVNDRNNQPLPGVTVVVKGTTTGTITGADGRFSVNNLTENSVLVFSFVGMQTQEIAVGTQQTINVTMLDETIGIDEVVAIGYANARKQDLSVAVATVKVDDKYKGRPSSLGTIIQGEMPGVRVVQTGDPTAGAEISIRGRGNRGGDGVLYVVDGVPGAPFNVSDVETITVLKDAASAAIYGAYAGSGGVIIITTRQAKAQKVSVTANVWNGVQEAWRLPEVLTAEQFNNVWKDASVAAGRNVPAAYDPMKFPYGNVTRTDWVDAIFRAGYMQHYDVTLQGGSKDIRALASVSYDNTQGTLITTYAENMTARLNVDFSLNDWTTLSQRMVYNYWNGKSGIGGGHTGAVFAAMAYPRFATVFEYDNAGNKLPGGTVPRWALAEGFSVEADLFNPVTQLENSRQFNPSNRIFSSTSLELKPITGLNILSSFSYDLSNSRNEFFTKKFTAPGRTVDQNYRGISNSLNRGWNWENTISYSREIADKHLVNVLGGFTMNYSEGRWNRTETRGYDFEYENYTIFPNAGEWGYEKPGEQIWQESIVSALGRLSYSYADRYFLTASVRRDASSKLSPDNNSDIFPAVSGAWKVSSESFMPQSDKLSFLKLRASWGQVGNIRSVRRFIYSPPLSVGAYGVYLGENAQNQMFGIFQSTIPNPDLKWERTEQTNVGIDLGMFKNSLNVNFDYFYKLTKDLIETMPVPSVAGVASPPEVNIGQVENYGWELALSYNKKLGDFELNLKGNLGNVKNNVLNIGERAVISHSDDINSQKPLQSTVGQPWYSYYLIDAVGLFKSQDEINAHSWTNTQTGATKLIQPNAKPGDIKYRDANNDGIINDGDRVYMGSYDFPDLSYGFTLGGSWKNFSLNMFWQGIAGVEIYNGVKAMSSSGLKGWNMTTDILESFEYNPNSGIPRLSFISDPNGNYSLVSSYFLDKGDYLRLKNLNLSYTIPTAYSQRIGMGSTSSIRLYVNGENLLTFTPYKAFDPEVGNRGIDSGRFPVSRMYSVGVNVSF
jgi:TonB-linked SusC/RagA family outer membrane protein